MAATPDAFYRRALYLTLLLVSVHGVLVATHEGEFWPFSIYPMFSTGAEESEKVVVRDVSAVSPDAWWDVPAVDDLPGTAFPLAPRGIDVNDLANFVARTEDWTPERLSSLHALLRSGNAPAALLVVRVTSFVDDGGSLFYRTAPLLVLENGEAHFPPTRRGSPE